MPDIPGSISLDNVTYVNYSNAPSEAVDGRGVVYRGQLMHKGGVSAPLHYVVMRLDLAGAVLIWESEAGAGSGSLSAAGSICYNVGQGKGSVARSLPIPGWVAMPHAKAWIVVALQGLLSTDALADWRKRVKW